MFRLVDFEWLFGWQDMLWCRYEWFIESEAAVISLKYYLPCSRWESGTKAFIAGGMPGHQREWEYPEDRSHSAIMKLQDENKELGVDLHKGFALSSAPQYVIIYQTILE